MKAIAIALLAAVLTGCAIVPVGPPVYGGISVDYGYRHPWYGSRYHY